MKTFILLIVIISYQINATSILDYYDKIVLSGEAQFIDSNAISNDNELGNIWLYASLPNIKIKNRSIFSAMRV